VSDRTDWRRMLKGNADDRDLAAEAQALVDKAAEGIAAVQSQFEDRFDTAPFRVADQDTVAIRYPVDIWPDKIKAHNLDKVPEVDATLNGIKGQYLIFDDGVLNVRKYTSYELVVTAG
ncbi:MAG: DUF2797 domain-containing protein, partial [Pseudomonadota bacterium]